MTHRLPKISHLRGISYLFIVLSVICLIQVYHEFFANPEFPILMAESSVLLQVYMIAIIALMISISFIQIVLGVYGIMQIRGKYNGHLHLDIAHFSMPFVIIVFFLTGAGCYFKIIAIIELFIDIADIVLKHYYVRHSEALALHKKTQA